MDINVKNGVVNARGHVKTPVSRDKFIENAQQIPGVKTVNTDHLYDDSTLRLDVAKVLPYGVYSNLQYGAVILTGKIPEGTTEKKLTSAIRKIKGVRAVLLNF
jgi:osmotically-inducible protein OsmY